MITHYFASLVSYSLLHFHLSHMAVYHLHFYHFHLLLLVQSFILNLRLGCLTNPFLHRRFPLLLDWFQRILSPFNALLCSTAAFVCMVCFSKPTVNPFSNALKSQCILINFISYSVPSRVSRSLCQRPPLLLELASFPRTSQWRHPADHPRTTSDLLWHRLIVYRRLQSDDESICVESSRDDREVSY